MVHRKLIGPGLAGATLLVFGGTAVAQSPIGPAIEMTSLTYVGPGISTPAGPAAAPGFAVPGSPVLGSVDAMDATFAYANAVTADEVEKGGPEAEAKGESETKGESDGPGGHADPPGGNVQHEFQGQE